MGKVNKIKVFLNTKTKRGTNLGEVANEMTAVSVHLRHDVKEKWLHVKVQRLVIEKKFGE